MAQVTSGLVSIEDGLKRAEEYAPPRKVRVELSFGVGEGENYEAIFDTVSQAASNRVQSLLHGPAISAVTSAAAEAGEPASPPATPPKRTRRTAAQIEADKAALLASETGASGDAPTSDDPAAIGGDDLTTAKVADPADLSDLSEFDVRPTEAPSGGASPAPVTDADLNSAVQKKNAEISDPNAIRALIGGYNPDPTQVFQLRQIPADKRGEFLTKLAALTKAA